MKNFSLHYGLRAMGAMSLRISELSLPFSPHPNISDGNVILVHQSGSIKMLKSFWVNVRSVSFKCWMLTTSIGVTWSWYCLCACTDWSSSAVLGCVAISGSGLGLKNIRVWKDKNHIWKNFDFKFLPLRRMFCCNCSKTSKEHNRHRQLRKNNIRLESLEFYQDTSWTSFVLDSSIFLSFLREFKFKPMRPLSCSDHKLVW